MSSRHCKLLSALLFLIATESSCMSKDKLVVAVVTDTHIGEGCNENYNFDNCKPVRTLTDVVSQINRMKEIDAVFATGDLTDSGLKEQFQKFREIMNELTVPWWPLFGNHDSWPYHRHSDGTFDQTDTPIGDQYFSEVFGDILNGSAYSSSSRGFCLESATTSWPQGTSPNLDFPPLQSWFHNFVVTFPTFSTNFHVVNLDWVAREAALPEPGVGPQAELHDFPGGTYQWLDEYFGAMDEAKRIQERKTPLTAAQMPFHFFMQHHPFHNRESWAPFGHNVIMNFTFDDKQNKRVQEIFTRHSITPDHLLGVHAGHMHRWYDGRAFNPFTALSEDWLKLREWETPASKGWWVNEDYVSSFTTFTFFKNTTGTRPEEATGPVRDGVDDSVEVVGLEGARGYWKVPPDGEWEVKPIPMLN